MAKFILALPMILAPLMMAQSISGDLVVKLSDSSNASVAGAKMVLKQVETNIKTEANTDNAGTALFLQLKPGRYQLDASHAGFQSQTIRDIRIQVGQRARVD